MQENVGKYKLSLKFVTIQTLNASGLRQAKFIVTPKFDKAAVYKFIIQLGFKL